MAAYPRKRPAHAAPEQLARGLGWFSIGIGIAQVVAPRTVARLCGVPVPPPFMVLCGLREIVCGVGLLTQDEPQPWIRTRLAGDALDLVGVGAGALVPGADRRRLAVAGAAVAGVSALDAYCSYQLTRSGRHHPPRHETITIEIDCDAQTLYGYWRELANLPQVMPHVSSVQEIDETHSHWVSGGAGDSRLEWDAEIIDDVPGQRIAWRSVEGSNRFHAGSVQFQPLGERTTQVRVDLLYERPPATLLSALATLCGFDPSKAARADLRALKRRLEQPENRGKPSLIG
jgi:uncharacterized membrane protein